MGEAFIVRRGGAGGGGGMPLTNAVIHAKAPLGSTVTFSKGGVVVKSIGPDKAHPNSDGEYADYYLSVSASNYGSWTMTATRGDYSTSGTVTVNANDQYDVLLRYIQYLFEDGDQCTAITGGWNAIETVTITDSVARWPGGQTEYGYRRGAFATVNKIALGGRTQLKAKFKVLTDPNSGNAYRMHICLSTQNTQYVAGGASQPVDVVGQYTPSDVGSEILITADLSDYKNSSDYYVYCRLVYGSGEITKVWLDW